MDDSVAGTSRQALGASYVCGKHKLLYNAENQRHLVRNVTRPAGQDLAGIVHQAPPEGRWEAGDVAREDVRGAAVPVRGARRPDNQHVAAHRHAASKQIPRPAVAGHELRALGPGVVAQLENESKSLKLFLVS